MLRAGEGAAADAAGAVTAALRALGGPARVVVTFATEVVAEEAQQAAGAVPVVGCAATGVVGSDGEREGEPAVVALAIGGDEDEGTPCEAFRSGNARAPGPDLAFLASWRFHRPGLALLFADAYSGHPGQLTRDVAAALPGWSVAGGVATAEDGVHPAHRWVDGEVMTDGVAGLLLGEPALVAVARGCLAVGPEHVVTGAEGRVVATLDGRPAFEVFAERARPLLDDLPRAAQSIFVEIPGGELRGLLRFDPDRGLLDASEPIPEGTRVRFAVRDPAAARAELRRAVAGVAAALEGRRPRFGFYFDSAGRGRGLFGVADHDLAHIQATLGRFPLIGFAGGGELAGDRAHLFAGVLAVVP